MSVLLLGTSQDPILCAVLSVLLRRSVETRIGSWPAGIGVSELSDWQSDIDAVLVRPTGSEACLTDKSEHELQTWLDLTPAMVLNRPSAASICASKPAQLRLLQDWGWDVPATLVTTSISEVLAFRERHGEVIVKGISSVRNRVRLFEGTNDPRLALLHWCPTQFQQRIAGTDYRVHVVGDQIFCCRIESSAVDYRSPEPGTTESRLMQHALPDWVADRCRLTCRKMGLGLAGIDLRCTPDDRWVIFEVNAMPGFTVFETKDDAPISEAVAELLIRARLPSAANDQARSRSG